MHVTSSSGVVLDRTSTSGSSLDKVSGMSNSGIAPIRQRFLPVLAWGSRLLCVYLVEAEMAISLVPRPRVLM